MESDLIKRLKELTEEELARIYMNVFNTDEGKLILQDLRNRCFFNAPIGNEIEEGMRRVVLHLDTMLTPWEEPTKKEEE